LIAAIYGYIVKPELMTRVFIEKITSPAGMLTGLVFVVGTVCIIWKKLTLTSKPKGQ